MKKRIINLLITIVFLTVISIIGITSPIKESYSMTGYNATKEDAWDGFIGLYIAKGTEAIPGGVAYVQFYGPDRVEWDCKEEGGSLTCNPIEGTEIEKNYVQITFKEVNNGKSFSSKLERGEIIIPDSVKPGEKYEVVEVLIYWKDGRVDYYGADEKTSENQIAAYNSFGEKYIDIVEGETINTTNSIELINTNLDNSTLVKSKKSKINLEYTGKISYGYMTMISFSVDNGLLLSSPNFKYLEFDEDNSIYIDTSDMLYTKYQVTSLTLCEEYQYNCVKYDRDDENSSILGMFTVVKPEEENSEEESTSRSSEGILGSFNVYAYKNLPDMGDRVYFTIAKLVNLQSMLVTFENTDNNEIIDAYVKDVNSSEPYIIVPTASVPGTYTFKMAVLTDEEGNVYYYNNKTDKIEGFSYIDTKASFVIEEEAYNEWSTKSLLVFNNSDFFKYIEKFDSLTDDALIHINATSNPLIFADVFDKIRNTNRKLVIDYTDSEWVFNGKDIVTCKNIDVSMLLSPDPTINISDLGLSSDIWFLDFKDNGILPGRALIRIKSSRLSDYFGNSLLSVYRVNDENTGLVKIALEIQNNDGYYEFYINHNSTYVLSKEVIDSDKVEEDESVLRMNSIGKDSVSTSKTKCKGEECNALSKKETFIIAGIIVAIVIIAIIMVKSTKEEKKE